MVYTVEYSVLAVPIIPGVEVLCLIARRVVSKTSQSKIATTIKVGASPSWRRSDDASRQKLIFFPFYY